MFLQNYQIIFLKNYKIAEKKNFEKFGDIKTSVILKINWVIPVPLSSILLDTTVDKKREATHHEQPLPKNSQNH